MTTIQNVVSPYVLAWDLGNGYFKGMSDFSKPLALPNYLLLYSDYKGEKLAQAPDVYICESDPTKTEYIWMDVPTAKNKVLTYSKSKRYQRAAYKYATQIGIVKLLPLKKGVDETFYIYGQTGVPNKEASTDAEASKHEQDLYDVIMENDGEFTVIVNGDRKTVKIVDLYITNQPMGTLYNALYNGLGVEENEDLMQSNVLVFDCGSGTNDFSFIRNGMIQRDGIDSTEDAMLTVYAEVAKEVTEKKGITFEPQEYEKAYRNGSTKVKDGRKEVDFTEEITKAIGQMLFRMEGFVSSKFDLDRADYIILTGGTANSEIFKDEFKNVFMLTDNDIHVMSAPQMSNVMGYFKRIKRRAVLEIRKAIEKGNSTYDGRNIAQFDQWLQE
ncbi:ParM/StbA family protein [Aneurinibacillus tyrosinisolvens]|uniref:ParM/StbA family protein n=1 Tax=Aneurinibacillus tyrosinisolvens TaxID=1443435 RepID=UPI00063F4583|nr:ParM/StbA family protein [Aneurinibacillus tyrosinisolvens]